MYKTDHKKVLMNLFESNPDNTYSGKALVDSLKNEMNKATVYRQLKALEDEDYIRKIYNPKDNSYEYQYSENCHEHFHLMCKECGRIIHLTCKEANVFISHISAEHSFLIDPDSTSISGLCKECQGK